LSQPDGQDARMKLIDHRYNESADHLTLTLRFGDAVVITAPNGRQWVQGGSESDRNAARIWLKYFVNPSRPTRD